LGNCYYYGNGVDAHRGRAKHWYAKASEQGHAEAMYGLSLCCLDEEESFAWCEKAAELGHAEAQFQMGMYYDDDDTWVVQPSYDKAHCWYAKAAEHDTIIETQSCLDALDEAREQMEQWMHEAPQGNPEVLYGLAECYEFGAGTERDYRLAKEYYTRAYEAKEPDDAVEHYFHQRGYKEMMTYLDQLIQVAEWEEMAEEGDTNAMILLSKYYEYDALYEEKLKPKRAIYWLRRAANSGNTLAQVLLGSHYELGNVVLKDNDEAFKLYSLAAEQGDAWGQYEVGHCHELGIGVEKDMKEAIRWYALSASQGGIDARNALHRIKDWYSFPGHENPVYVSLAQAALENLKKENRE
jgi:TPR repeat protein